MSLAKWFVLGNRYVLQPCPIGQEGSVQGERWEEFSQSWKGTHHRVIACTCLWKSGSLCFIYSFNKYVLPICVLKSKSTSS